MSLQNGVAVITGATGGLGQVVARTLAQQGARLAMIGTRADRLEELEKELALPADCMAVFPADLTEPEAARQVAELKLARFGRVDFLLHFVGGWIGGKAITEVPAEDVAQMLNQHLWTTLYLVQALVPTMIAQGTGRVIVITSPTASRPVARRAPYAIGKAAQEALMLTLADEVKGSGVTANLLVVNTIDVEHERDRDRSPRTANWTTPEEIASVIVYLCSEEAHTINGARIPMYGSA